jgi:hypothetical protein
MNFTKYVLIFTLTTSLSGCSDAIRNHNSSKIIKDDFYFFPKGVFNGINDKKNEDSFYRKWFSSQLAAMGEPSLSIQNQNKELVFRFLWLRSFHHPIAIRIEKQSDSIFLFLTELTGMGGYNPGEIYKSYKIKISMNDFNKITLLIEEIDFWNMSTVLSLNNSSETITIQADGAEWIFEGKVKEKYHVVRRWSPESGNFRELCLFFIKLAGLSLNPKEIY